MSLIIYIVDITFHIQNEKVKGLDVNEKQQTLCQMPPSPESAAGQVKTYGECQDVAKSGQAWNEEKKRDEQRGRDKEMDEEKWVQLVPFVSPVLGPQSFRSTGRAEKAPVMTC